jgi:hypothetical protein
MNDSQLIDYSIQNLRRLRGLLVLALLESLAFVNRMAKRSSGERNSLMAQQ